MDKVLGILETFVPEEGFVNGMSAPTQADLAILVMTQAMVPFLATLQGYDFGKVTNPHVCPASLSVPLTCLSVHC